MKKTILSLTLLVITLCKAADVVEQEFYQALPNNWQERTLLVLSDSQIKAIPGNFNPLKLQSLKLNNNQIRVIPNALQLNELMSLSLKDNNIQEINPQRLLKQFPKLRRIDLSGNTDLDKRFIADLRDEAQKAGRGESLKIIARDIYVAPLGLDAKG